MITKKALLCVTALSGVMQSHAQNDSTVKFRISGFQSDISMLGSNQSRTATRGQFQKLVSGNELLNRDLSGYMASPGNNGTNFDGHFSVKVFADLPTRMKRARLEAFAGLRFGSVTLSSAYYSKDTYDTTGVYVNPVNNAKLVTANDYFSGYNYSFTSIQLSLPFGLNISSNKKRRFWFTAGVELSPGIHFSNQFEAYHNVSNSEVILNASTQLSNYASFVRSSYTQIVSEYSSKAVKGVGFVGYATLPLSINIRVSKQITWMKHLSLTGAAAPGLYVSKNRFFGTSSNAILNLSVGIRYALKV